MPSRLITDNVLIAFELNYYINSKNKSRDDYMTLKLDMSKAYNRVEWIFLRKVLLRLSLTNHFVDLNMMCVTSVSYAFMLSGAQFGLLHPSRGLRLGDPLSPYLFICMVEAFIALIQREERQGFIKSVKIARNAPTITSLCFADDILLFYKAMVAEAVRLKGLLDLYAAASGQFINFDKSSMTFSRGANVSKDNQISMSRKWRNITSTWVYRRHWGDRRRRFLGPCGKES